MEELKIAPEGGSFRAFDSMSSIIDSTTCWFLHDVFLHRLTGLDNRSAKLSNKQVIRALEGTFLNPC